MKHIKNFRNVLNMLHIASRTFIVNNSCMHWYIFSTHWPTRFLSMCFAFVIDFRTFGLISIVPFLTDTEAKSN